MTRPFPVLAVLLLASVAPAGDIGFVEEFALARDRAEALKLLVPGTEDALYYQSLHLLNTERYDQVRQQIVTWRTRFGQTGRLTEIETRLALLTYDRDPKASLAYLREKLQLQYPHRKEVPGAVPDLPTRLDPALVSRDTLARMSLQRWGNLQNFEDVGLDRLARTDLDANRRRDLLRRLRRPDMPGLARLIDADMRAFSTAFGGRPIDSQLTLHQLDELAGLNAPTLNQPTFVTTYLTKLLPGADDDRTRDPAVARAHLERCQAFTDRLAPVHNPLKAHVLYHRLVLDRTAGIYDQARFLRYLALPRHQPYMAPRLLDAPVGRQFPADLNADYSAATLLPPVRSDEPLVRDYLKHLLRDAANADVFAPLIQGDYLRELFAEAKIEAGLGDPERWAAMLSPERFRALRERVDIDFASTNKTVFPTSDPVALDLFVKNVSTLRVRVFEINTTAVYRTTQREIDTDLQLDGLVPNVERTLTFPDPPLLRVARHIEFPELVKPGVYVIDFIGSGKSSRALVRKGRLRPLTTPAALGLKVRAVDETNKPVPAVTVWLGGTEYAADKEGVVTIPFSTSPGRKPVVLSANGVSSLDFIDHPGEGYALTAGVAVDREQLLTNRIASVLVRPSLTVNGRPASIKLLENPRLRVVSIDHAGVSSALEVPAVPLHEDRDTVQEVRVPARLASLSVTLTGTVKSLTQDKPIELSHTESVTLNGVDRTDKIESLHLLRTDSNWVVELLGKTGEAKPDRSVRFSFKHREFREPVTVNLKTDPRGRITLGLLPEVVSVAATGPDGTHFHWPLPDDARHTRRQVIHAAAGEPVRLAYTGTLAAPSRDEVALFEVNGNIIRTDRFDAISIKDGQYELAGLAAGDYDLWLKPEAHTIRVRIAAGPQAAGFVLGRIRELETPGLAPVQIASVATDEAGLAIKLVNVSPYTRVHVFADRYRPGAGMMFDPFVQLAQVRGPELGAVYPGYAPSVYLTGRDIGDEYRYVLDRQGRKRFPGVMLDRPGLLLNPWAVRPTETGVQDAATGGMFGGVGAVLAPKSQPAPTTAVPASGSATVSDFANLDFLADAALVLTNLAPDANGLVRVGRDRLGPHSYVHVVAVDPLATAVRSVGLPERPTATLDLRLSAGLDPAGHFTQRQAVSLLENGKPFTVADVAASRFKAYDSLADVHALYVTLLNDPKLTEFAFVTKWPSLKPEEKRAKYSQFASHELNFFLSRKDPEFFAAVVRPHLANKKDKTFLDHYLLGSDLAAYVKPWAFERLNAVERTLLARRLADERPRVARHLADLLKLTPPLANRQRLEFEFGLAADALGSADDFGTKKGRLLDEMTRRQVQNEDRQRGVILGKPGADLPTPGQPAAPPAAAGATFGGRFKSTEAEGRGRPKRDAGQDKKTELAERSAEMKKKSDDSPYFFDGAERDKQLGMLRQLYRRLDPTVEWAENNYHRLPIAQQVYALVPVGPLWAEWAAAPDDKPFLSIHLASAARSFTEAMFTLSVLDLPFEPAKHKQEFAGGGMTYTPASAVIAFHEQVKPAAAPPANPTVLLSQNVYRADDRYREENGERADKFVTDEFLTQVVYGSQVVVTNPTSGRQKLTVLIQLPVGSLPVGNVAATRTVHLDLEPYRTEAVNTLFYFPRPGTFAQFPVHVAKGETVVAAAPTTKFTVVEKPTRPDTTSWEYVSQNGSQDDVLTYLRRENVHALNLDRIAWRMHDKAAFTAILQALNERHAYSPTLWSYALQHDDPAAAQQYLLHADQLVTEAGGPLVSPLLTIDPVARHTYEHLEYRPLVNARAHQLGARREIVNPVLLAQYQRFLKTLTYRRELSDTDRLAVTYYLLLQDRIEEAGQTFASVNAEAVPSKLQYDYCAAYLGLATGDPTRVRSLATKHANTPVDRWRELFGQMVKHLDEAEGKTVTTDAGDRDKRQGSLAATEPAVDVSVSGKQVAVTARNLQAVIVNYYLMDVELLFSRSPFVQQTGGSFAVIRPNKSATLAIPAGGKATVSVPAELAAKNLLVEVTGGGKTRSGVYYAGAVELTLAEGYGQLTATSSDGKPLAAAYVKVYAKLADGRVLFHKDGYTDRRGRFDYATVSTPERGAVARFAVLVLDDTRGAALREAAPPPQ